MHMYLLATGKDLIPPKIIRILEIISVNYIPI